MDRFRSKITALRNQLAAEPLLRGAKRLHSLIYASLFLIGSFSAWFGMQLQGVPEAVSPLSQARLLASEALADGALSRPAQPGGIFLQTYLTLQFPRYVAATPPGNSVFLAVGTALDDTLLGLWLQCGLFTLATAWMIRGFSSMRWAVIGALLSALWYGTLSYWGQSYDGWTAPALGIALMWGAARRYHGRQGIGNSAILSFAIGWSLHCAPITSLFALPVPLYLWYKSYSAKGSRRELAGLLLPLLAAVCIQMAYNQATTDNPLKSPAKAYREKYNNHPLFIWQPPALPPEYDFVRMEQHDLKINQTASRLEAPVMRIWSRRAMETLGFYAGIPVCILLVGAFWSGLSGWGKWLLRGAGISLSSIILILPYDLEYTASLACIVPLLAVWAMRSLWIKLGKRGVDCWRLSAWLLAAVLVATHVRGLGAAPDEDLTKHAKYKKEITDHLLKTETGRHLVLVSYDINVPPKVEYVHNSYTPDEQKIVWARWNTKLNASELFSHHKGRTLWLLSVKPDQLPSLRKMDWRLPEQNQVSDTQSRVELEAIGTGP